MRLRYFFSKLGIYYKDLVHPSPLYLYTGCILTCLVLLNCLLSILNTHHVVKLFKQEELGSSASNIVRLSGKQNSTYDSFKNSKQYSNLSYPSTDEIMKNFIPNVKVSSINCAALVRENKLEIVKAKQIQRNNTKRFLKNADFLHLNCSRFIKERKYTMYPLSKEELEFPLAFSILIFKDLEQFERLLRAIYRPQNYYCVHVDAKVSEVMWESTRALVRCFSNVFMASQSVRVMWGTYSVLQPEFICMKDLWPFQKWRYFINLTGQEFPLQTMGNIVKILKSLKGANNAEGTVKRSNKQRTRFVRDKNVPRLSIEKFHPPVPVTITKGSVHIIAQRGFVDFVLHDKRASKFQEWVRDTAVPDETFFSSLIYSPQLEVPGAYLGRPETDKIDSLEHPRNPFIARFKNWGNSIFNWTCHGVKMRGICVFGVGDLHLLSNRRELFANKFILDYQPLAYDCMEEIYYNNTREEIKGTYSIDLSFYTKLDIVENHL